MDIQRIYKMAGTDAFKPDQTVSSKTTPIVPTVPTLSPLAGDRLIDDKLLNNKDNYDLSPLSPLSPPFQQSQAETRATVGCVEGQTCATKSKDEGLLNSLPDCIQVAVINLVNQACSHHPITADEMIEALSVDDYKEIYSGEITAINLNGFAITMIDKKARDQGRVPEGWDSPSHCKGCGSVWLPTGAASKVLGCPWCLQRSKGIEIPRP